MARGLVSSLDYCPRGLSTALTPAQLRSSADPSCRFASAMTCLTSGALGTAPPSLTSMKGRQSGETQDKHTAAVLSVMLTSAS